MQQRFSLFGLLILPSFLLLHPLSSPPSSSPVVHPPLFLYLVFHRHPYILLLCYEFLFFFYFIASFTDYYILSFPDLLLLLSSLSSSSSRPTPSSLKPPLPLQLFYIFSLFLFLPITLIILPFHLFLPTPVSSPRRVIFHACHQPDVTPEQHVSLCWRSMGPGFHIFSLFTSSFVFIFFFTDVGHLTVWHRFQISAAGALIHYSSVPSRAAIGCRERRKYVSTTCWCTASCGQRLIDICFLAAAGSRNATVAMSS